MNWIDSHEQKPPKDHIVNGLISVWFIGESKYLIVPVLYSDDIWYSFHFDNDENEIKSYVIGDVKKWCELINVSDI
jgi:hypothetical protein